LIRQAGLAGFLGEHPFLRHPQVAERIDPML
jgi:hypothetical protein